MIYLDYSATTPVEETVLDSFCKTCREYVGNPNSLHKLGVESKQLHDRATKQIADLLGVRESEIIYTSGSSESNNLAIKGIALQYQNRGKHILTTPLEHSSVVAPLQYLSDMGFEVEMIPLKEDGCVDVLQLKQMLREDTILVTMASVSSELGIRQPIEEIGQLLKQYPKCFFHVDMTQSIGKVEIPFTNIDLASFSAHKFYGLKGIGCLIKKEPIRLVPLIHGGKSTTIYRSGTPALPLIVSLAKALRLSLEEISSRYQQVEIYHQRVETKLREYPHVTINSTNQSIPHILNFSVLGVKPETFQHALEEENIYISTQTACSSGKESSAVYAITKDKEASKSSLRVSFSYKTTEEEITLFLEKFDACYHRLQIRNEHR